MQSISKIAAKQNILVVSIILLVLTGNLFAKIVTVFGYSIFTKSIIFSVCAFCLIVSFYPCYLRVLVFIFGFSFFLFGFHSFSIHSQMFEFLVTATAICVLIANFRDGIVAHINSHLLILSLSYILLSTLSILLLPIMHIIDELTIVRLSTFLHNIFSAAPSSYFYSISGVNRLIIFFTFAIVLAGNTDSRKLYKILFCGVLASCLISALLGLLEHLEILSLSWYRGFSVYLGLKSTFVNRGWFAEFILTVMPFVLFPFLYGYKNVFLKCTVICALILLEIVLILNGARTGWLSYPIVLFFCWVFIYLFNKARNDFERVKIKSVVKIIVSMPITIFVSVFLIYKVFVPFSYMTEGNKFTNQDTRAKSSIRYIKNRINNFTISGRPETWKESIHIGFENPVFGMGYETYNWHGNILSKITDSSFFKNHTPGRKVRDTSHNIFLQLYVSNGLVGLILWIFIVAYSLLILGLDLIKNKKYFNLLVAISIISFHMYGMFQSMQYIPMIWLIIFINFGYTMTINENILSKKSKKTWNYICTGVLIAVLIGGCSYIRNFESKKLAKKYGLKIYAIDQNRDDYIGFYSPEKWIDGTYRWTANNGLIKFSGNGILSYSFKVLHPDLKKNPVEVSVSMDGKSLDNLTFWEATSIGRQYFIPQNEKKNHKLFFSVNRTWNPKESGVNQDNRELGIAVSKIKHLRILPKDGFGLYSPERIKEEKVFGWPKEKPLKYRWTQQRASINLHKKFRNGGSIFIMAAHPQISKSPVNVELIGEFGVIRKLTISDTKWKKISLNSDDFGNSQMLTIQVDKTWNPKLSGISEDRRDLGVAIALLERQS